MRERDEAGRRAQVGGEMCIRDRVDLALAGLASAGLAGLADLVGLADLAPAGLAPAGLAGLAGLADLVAVSYTHLDVYKRQDLQQRRTSYRILVTSGSCSFRCALISSVGNDKETTFTDSSDRKSTRLNSSHRSLSRMPSSA